MDEEPRQLIEWGADAAAAALLAASLAFASVTLVGPGPGAAAAAIAAFALAFAGLRRVAPAPPTFLLPAFEPMTMHAEGSDPHELLQDDLLAGLAPDSRVVRLLQPVELPTAGELQATIDRHLRSGSAPPIPPDATHTLHEALAELRRSLR